MAATVDRSSGPDACWPWLGRRDRDGYGRIQVKGKAKGAHVVALELATGEPVPSGELVRHSCDNPPCCNPLHLLSGDHADNSADAKERGRTLSGERCSSAKLSDEQADEIRRLCAGGKYGIFTQLAKKFGVSSRQISYIATGKRRAA
jgi:hypothetical protein